MLSRRAILVSGGAAALILGTGSCSFLNARRMTAAREPWRQAAEGFGDARLDMLAYAILAPSPHNRQPWQIRLDGEDGLTVFCDPGRRLPETDPPDRQITIGFGAFLELLRQAAAEKGYRAEIAAFPGGEPYPRLDGRPIASVRLVPDITTPRDPLFAEILTRRTVHEPYDLTRPLGEAVTADLTRLSALPAGKNTSLFFTSAPEEVSWFRDVCGRGWEAEIGNPGTLIEGAELTRIGAAEIRRTPDGIPLSGPVMETLKLAGLLTSEQLNTPGSFAYEQSLTYYKDQIDASPAFAWMTTPGNTRADQLSAGARWVRLQQAAAQLGIATQPLSQVLEEFPAMSACYEEVHDRLDVPLPARVQGIFRLGHAPYPKAAPRWPLPTLLLT